MTTSAQYAPVGILGAAIFVIAAVVQLLRTRIVETEALAEQRGLDLRNVVELNEYIMQHLRESIVVVDGENRIRLINESAAQACSAAARRSTDEAAARGLAAARVTARDLAHGARRRARRGFQLGRRREQYPAALRAAR